MAVTDDDPESQVKKRRVMLQDADLRNQSRNGDTGTYLRGLRSTSTK
jgi:hypothetical protein